MVLKPVGLLGAACAATVMTVEPVIELFVALIVVVPIPAGVARPVLALMVAFAVSLDVQAEEPVMTEVVASVYVPVATNCCVDPYVTLGVDGVTAIETKAAALTVNPVFPEIPPNVAVMVGVPVVKVLSSPFDPLTLLIVATPVLEEVHVTCVVNICVVESVYVPVATNC